MKILFTGGGTGGHLTPIIAIARELRRLNPEPGLELFYIGPKMADYSLSLIHENITIKTIMDGKIRRYFSFQNVADILCKIPFGFLQSVVLLMMIRPQLVFSKGGSGSFSVLLAANILRIPIFLHESDVAPGMSNRLASHWAKKIFISFAKTEYFDLNKTLLIGNPSRKELTEGNAGGAKETLGLELQKPVLLFWGGSQGADAINEFVVAAANDLLKRYEIIHVCGKNNLKKTRAAAEALLDKDLKKYYHLYDMLNEVPLKHAYYATKLAISRAGASSIFEMALCGKPSILVPLPGSASDHQSKNAYQYASTGAAIIIEQENLTPGFVAGKIDYLMAQSEKLEEMKAAALAFAKPLAAKAVAREMLEYLR